MIDVYKGISPKGDLVLLRKFGKVFGNRVFLHVNSTREGGGRGGDPAADDPDSQRTGNRRAMGGD